MKHKELKKKIHYLAQRYYTFQKKQTKLSIANLVKGECSINLLVGYILNRANFPSILITRNHHWRMDPQLIITQWPNFSKIQNTENQDSEIKTKPKLTNQPKLETRKLTCNAQEPAH